MNETRRMLPHPGPPRDGRRSWSPPNSSGGRKWKRRSIRACATYFSVGRQLGLASSHGLGLALRGVRPKRVLVCSERRRASLLMNLGKPGDDRGGGRPATSFISSATTETYEANGSHSAAQFRTWIFSGHPRRRLATPNATNFLRALAAFEQRIGQVLGPGRAGLRHA